MLAINGTRKSTPKQQAFAYYYVETGNGSEAYRRAYNALNMSANAVAVEACRLLRHPKVALKVQQLRDKVTERMELSIVEVLSALVEDRALARKLGNPSAAIRADVLLGKHIGMWPNKVDVSGTVDHTVSLEGLTLDEKRELAAAALERRLGEGTVIEGTATVLE